MSALIVRGLDVAYGPIRAVRKLDLEVGEGELFALLGTNGAGKSSTLQAILGMVPTAAGQVTLGGTEITGWRPERVVRAGMTLVPEGRRVFGSLSVAENLRLGAALGRGGRWERRIHELFPILMERSGQAAGTLSGGEQQQLAIARALLADPSVLLLDEPSLGLAPTVVDRIFELVKTLQEEGLTLVLVEQNVERSLDICDRAVILASGEKVAEQTADELREDRSTLQAHFGLTGPTP